MFIEKAKTEEEYLESLNTILKQFAKGKGKEYTKNQKEFFEKEVKAIFENSFNADVKIISQILENAKNKDKEENFLKTK